MDVSAWYSYCPARGFLDGGVLLAYFGQKGLIRGDFESMVKSEPVFTGKKIAYFRARPVRRLSPTA
jgi:hypothetical protein